MAKDPFVRSAWGLLVLLSLPYFIPILDENQLWYYGAYFLDLPLLAFLEIVLLINLVNTKNPNERRFWGWLVAGFSLWGLQSALEISLINHTEVSTATDLFSYFLYFGFYACVVMALESRPHIDPEKSHRRLLVLDRIGALVFLFGLLLYLTVLPGLVDWESYWTSTLILFAVLDLFIVLRLLAFRRTVQDGAWLSTYTWLLAASALWFLTDLTEVLMWAEIAPYLDSGTAFDIFWIVALPVVVIAARASLYGRSTESSQTSRPQTYDADWEALGIGPIVVYAVAVPLFHLMFYRFGFADPALKSIRELLTVAIAFTLAVIAFAYQQLLRRENERLSKQRVQIQDKLEHQAYHDVLTGLPNRRHFREHLALGTALARRRQNHCAVLFCDLDEFKVINDSLGHATGDRFLVEVARRLRESIRSSDTVARLGGDEFAILVHDLENEFEVLPIVQHLFTTLRAPIVLEDSEHVFTASIGIALFPEDGTDEATLLKHADIAMYQAKLKGRNTYQLFTPDMNREIDERLFVEKGLRKALAADSLELLYQPILDVATKTVTGCEALLRWRHPEKGLISPDSFIDVAEKTGLIVPIGEWALETACELGQRLRGLREHGFIMAVNISPRQLQHPEFFQSVQDILVRTGFPASQLQLEVTESLAIEGESTIAVLAQLRELGMSVAIDDLGTGFSGLSRLRDLPVDVVKIDRSFIGGAATLDAAGEAIVQAIVGLARALDLHVVAEGVETDAQFDLVKKQGCHSVQGFLFKRPLPAEQIERMIKMEP